MPLAILFWSALSSVIGALVARVVTALGVGAVSYVGLDLLFGKVRDYLLTSVNGIGPDIYNGLAYFGIVAAINIFLSTMAAIATLNATKTALEVTKK